VEGQLLYPLELKPDLEEAAKRWQTYLAGEIIDRPLIHITAPRGERPASKWPYYHDAVFGDLEKVIEHELEAAENTYFGGEAVPTFIPSFGPDEVAVFCGAELCWSKGSPETNWSKPFVKDWEKALPLQLQEEHPLWRRMLTFYEIAAEKLAGKMLIAPLDLHTNMDLLAAVRGPQQLCLDLVDQPEVIDEAMKSARAIFPKLWNAIVTAGKMNERGYCSGFYSREGAAVLQCDFSYMISAEMFNRWVLPALEEEAEIVKHAYYHWDGVGALTHIDALCTSRGLHTLSFTTGAGHGEHKDWVDLLKRVQEKGKNVDFYGTPEECKAAHRELKPEKVMYATSTATPKEADELLKWFVANT